MGIFLGRGGALPPILGRAHAIPTVVAVAHSGRTSTRHDIPAQPKAHGAAQSGASAAGASVLPPYHPPPLCQVVEGGRPLVVFLDLGVLAPVLQ